jgi:hypothetical protein
MAISFITSVKPREENTQEWLEIYDWCNKNNIAFNAVFNAYLPAIAYALQNRTQQVKGIFYVQSDFGDIPITRRVNQYG